MKVLSVTWTIYDHRIEAFCSNCTGGGLVIKNLCEYIGRKEESYLLVGRYKLPAMKLGNINIVDTVSVEENDIEDKNERHLDVLKRAFVDALDEIQPDIVNVHGLGDFAIMCVEICMQRGVKCVFTEHLYIGYNNPIEQYEQSIVWEGRMHIIPGLKVIAVSEGVKRKVLKDFSNLTDEDIKVILNGTDFCADKVQSDLCRRYGLDGKKVLVCVGTICDRKNQEQLVDAFKLLPLEVQSDVCILFCGKDRIEGRLQEKILKAGLQDKLIYAGALSSEEMKQYYTISDGLIMPSLAEGLSIAALEQIAYGKPVIMFSDSECALDLNDDNVSCFAKEHDDQSLADAINEWYNKEWDTNYIVNYSKYFTMERMAQDYIDHYKTLIG